MVIFDKDNTPDSWASKVNFVDDNNRCVGFDMSSQCCEDFGWKITADSNWTPGSYGVYESSGAFNSETGTELPEEELKHYKFVDEEPMSEGDGLRFSLTDGTTHAFLWLWNLHNGYYAHGFDYDLGVNKYNGWL